MVIEYASLKGTLDGMDTTVITEIKDYFEKEIGYKVPPMTPFIGEAFNQTKAGVHADGLLKDVEIYNIFDTEKILNRPVTVALTKTSGLAGIAFWINSNYNLIGTEKEVSKHDELVVKIKEWMDAEYETGRATPIADVELHELVSKYSDLKKAYGTSTTNLFNHFLKYGMAEGRQAIDTFNVDIYKANYADLQRAFGNNLPSYYKHYCQYGHKENRKAV
jgi:isopropylmalate/homocitrate/citramalate synthase